MNGPKTDSPDSRVAHALTHDLPVAYIKAAMVEGKAGYAIHAATGEMIGWCEDRAVAFAAAAQHDLVALSVH